MENDDVTVAKYNRSGIAILFPAIPPVSLKVNEYLRTDYINDNSQGLLAGINEKEFKTFGDVGQGAPLPDVLGIYTSNSAIDKLSVALRTLQTHLYKDTLVNMEMPEWTKYYELNPYVEIKQIDPLRPNGGDELVGLALERQIANQDAEILAATLRLANIAGIDAFAIAHAGKVLRIVILTDPFIANRLNAQVPANPYLGAIVSSHHNDMRGRAYLTYALFDAETGEVDQTASFGNLLYTPSRFKQQPTKLSIGIVKEGDIESVTTVYTKVIVTLPILVGLFL